MKKGRSLTELAAELERQQNVKRDFVLPSKAMEMLPPEPEKGHTVPGLLFQTNGHKEFFQVNAYAHGQIANRLGIPKAYYDRMLTESPELMATNVNHWLKSSTDKRMVRVLDGKARAILSDRFRPLDNFDLMSAALPELMKHDGIRIESCEVTERRLYLKAVFPKIEGEVKKGDVIQAGLVISNSEIGAGSIRVEPLLFRLVCLNGMISNAAMRKYHVGKGHSLEDGAFELLSDKTRELTDAAFWAQVRDVVSGSLKRDVFEAQLDKLRAASDLPITSTDLAQVVEVTSKRFQLAESESHGVLRHLAAGGDLSAWGLANAITRTSQDVADYDRATDLERMGGEVIELSRKDWQAIATAA